MTERGKARLLMSAAPLALSGARFSNEGGNRIGEILNLPSQLESILGDMDRAFHAGLYYPALLVALTLPDVCIGLASPPDYFVKEKDYAGFVDTYSVPQELGVAGLECYRLRGGIVHRGNAAGHPFFGASHVLFCVPETRGIYHGLRIEAGDKAAKVLALEPFCRAMRTAVEKWYAGAAEDPRVINNLPKLLSWRANGLPPFLEGAPVVGSGV